MTRTLSILGGTGSIGPEVVSEATGAGRQVKAPARSAEAEQTLSQAGALPIRGDAAQPEHWIAETKGARALAQHGYVTAPASG
ncbi:MAG: hypothetical protein JWO42_2095 [Chloroflexi bacterium]|nr:hypothetical protein [Chloroflexota bacterium]